MTPLSKNSLLGTKPSKTPHTRLACPRKSFALSRKPFSLFAETDAGFCWVPVLFVRQIDADEAANGLAVVDRIFDTFVRQAKTLLGDVHAQHAFQANRRTTTATTFRVIRQDGRHQRRPGVAASISARKWSRRVSFFLRAYSASEKLDCIVAVVSSDGGRSSIVPTPAACR